MVSGDAVRFSGENNAGRDDEIISIERRSRARRTARSVHIITILRPALASGRERILLFGLLGLFFFKPFLPPPLRRSSRKSTVASHARSTGPVIRRSEETIKRTGISRPRCFRPDLSLFLSFSFIPSLRFRAGLGSEENMSDDNRKFVYF